MKGVILAPHVAELLKRLASDPSADALHESVWDTIDMISMNPGSAEARRDRIYRPGGQTTWMARVRVRHHGEPWVVVWKDQGADILIAHIGTEDFRLDVL